MERSCFLLLFTCFLNINIDYLFYLGEYFRFFAENFICGGLSGLTVYIITESLFYPQFMSLENKKLSLKFKELKMASHVFRVLEIEPLQQGESVIDMTPDNMLKIKATSNSIPIYK